MKPGAEFTANSCQNRWQRYPKPLWNAGVGCRKSLVGGPRRATESHDASNDLGSTMAASNSQAHNPKPPFSVQEQSGVFITAQRPALGAGTRLVTANTASVHFESNSHAKSRESVATSARPHRPKGCPA